MFGKEQPGRVRCYGRSITRSYLKKDEEILQIKQQHDQKVACLQNGLEQMQQRMDGLCNLMKVMLQQNNPGMSIEAIEALLQSAQISPPDANSAPNMVGRNVPNSSGSNHVPINENVSLLI